MSPRRGGRSKQKEEIGVLPFTSEGAQRLEALLKSTEARRFINGLKVSKADLKRFIVKEARWGASQAKRFVEVEDIEEAWDIIIHKGDLGVWSHELKKRIQGRGVG